MSKIQQIEKTISDGMITLDNLNRSISDAMAVLDKLNKAIFEAKDTLKKPITSETVAGGGAIASETDTDSDDKDIESINKANEIYNSMPNNDFVIVDIHKYSNREFFDLFYNEGIIFFIRKTGDGLYDEWDFSIDTEFGFFTLSLTINGKRIIQRDIGPEDNFGFPRNVDYDLDKLDLEDDSSYETYTRMYYDMVRILQKLFPPQYKISGTTVAWDSKIPK